MNLNLQYRIKSNPNYIRFLMENSLWYKYLNRNSNYFDDFVEKVKEEYHLRPIDKISKTIDTLDMVSSIISTLNS